MARVLRVVVLSPSSGLSGKRCARSCRCRQDGSQVHSTQADASGCVLTCQLVEGPGPLPGDTSNSGFKLLSACLSISAQVAVAPLSSPCCRA